MGACFKNVVWDGKLTYDEVKKKYQDMVNELLHMHGADAYNGTFTTCSGLAIQNGKAHGSEHEAYEWLCENAQKWENAIAVKFRDVKKVVPKPPSFGGKVINSSSDFGYRFVDFRDFLGHSAPKTGMKSCMIYEHRDWKTHSVKYTFKILPADALTALQQERLQKTVGEYVEARKDHKKKLVEFNSLIDSIKSYTQAIPESAFTQMKKLRKSLVTSHNKGIRLAEKLLKIDEKYEDRLWKTKEVDEGEKWMIGGWCSE
jgi:hypothetical protein